VTGATTTNGVTNTGNVQTDTLNTTGLATLNSAQVNTTLNVTGATTTNGVTNTGNVQTDTLNVTGASITNCITNTSGISNSGGINNHNSGITNAGAVSGVTTLSSQTINNSGTTTTQNLTVTNSATVNNDLTVTDDAYVGGDLTVAGTIYGDGAEGALTLHGGDSSTTVVIDNSGVNVSDSTYGQTFNLSNSGNVSTRLDVNVGDDLYVTDDAYIGGHTTTHGIDNSGYQITGVANGTTKYDAVNYGQLKKQEEELSGGIATAVAMTNIPQVDVNKTFALGVGIATYNSETGYAVGGSFRPTQNTDIVLKASLGGSSSGDTAFGIGGGFSW